MKTQFVIAFFCLYGIVFAGKKESMMNDFVVVTKDSLNGALPENKLLLHIDLSVYDINSGKGNELTSSQLPYYTLDNKTWVELPRNRIFELKIPSSTTFIGFKLVAANENFEIIYLENYPFQSQHELFVKVKIPPTQIFQIEVDKPVLYLYSDVEVSVDYVLQAKGDLSFTYPVLDSMNHLRIAVLPNELLRINQHYYPYVFWESVQTVNDEFKNPQGKYIVSQEHLLTFLENKLNQLGLNAREKTDFITYWCPKLKDMEFIELNFFLDEGCNIIASETFTPNLNQFRRVYVQFKKAIEVEEKTLQEMLPKNFNRIGLHGLEWGGSIVNQELNN